jgi:hypothetical protein
VFLKNGSMNRRLASLHWLQLGAVRQLRQYYQDAMTPCSHSAALRFLRLAVPQRSLVAFALRRTSAPPKPGVGNPVSPAGSSLRSEQGSPKFLGNHDCPFAMFRSDAGRTAYTRPYGAAAWPLVIERQRLPRKVFRRSIALLSNSLSTLRSADYSNATQDSLPVAGQALLDGLFTRKVPMKGFKVVNYILFPFPRLSWRNRCDRVQYETDQNAA